MGANIRRSRILNKLLDLGILSCWWNQERSAFKIFPSQTPLLDPGTYQQSRIQQAFVTSNILPATAPDPITFTYLNLDKYCIWIMSFGQQIILQFFLGDILGHFFE